jgi:hypothetical protein
MQTRQNNFFEITVNTPRRKVTNFRERNYFFFIYFFMNLAETECQSGDWTELAENRISWRDSVNKAINLWRPLNAGKFKTFQRIPSTMKSVI